MTHMYTANICHSFDTRVENTDNDDVFTGTCVYRGQTGRILNIHVLLYIDYLTILVCTEITLALVAHLTHVIKPNILAL